VTCDGERGPACRLDLGHRALGPVSHHVHDHDAVALPREVQRHLPGDGTPGTGHDHDSWLATRVGHVKLLNGAPDMAPSLVERRGYAPSDSPATLGAPRRSRGTPRHSPGFQSPVKTRTASG